MRNYLVRVNRSVLENYVGVIKKIEETRKDLSISIPYLERERVDLHREIFKQAKVTGKYPNEADCQFQLDKYLHEAKKKVNNT